MTNNYRNSNIELLRICCMLMIIAGHVMMNRITSYSLTNSDEIIRLLFRSVFCVAVNSFVIISGYFGIQFKKDRLAHLIIQTFFYSTMFMTLAIILGWHAINLRTDIFAFMPVFTKQYWFVTCYVVLYIISPWLNIWVDNLEQSVFRQFLVVGFLIFFLWPTFSFLINSPRFVEDSGFGIVNFVYLYMFGRYIRLHFIDKHSSIYYWRGYLLSVITLFLCQYILSWILGFEFTSWTSYNTVFCFTGSVCFFMTFNNMSFHSPIVNYWAKPCLAVYLIHMAPFLLNKFCLAIGIQEYHALSYLLLILTLPFVIYLSCAIIEIGRSSLLGGVENKIISFVMKFRLT